MVGKIEQGIPEDDPRNPATIADNVGDNVGDCASMAADVFESYIVTLVAAIVLGSAIGISHIAGDGISGHVLIPLIVFPLVIHGVGILSSILGIASVKGTNDITVDPLKIIGRGLWTTAAIAAIGFAAVAFGMPLLRDGVTVAGIAYPAWKFFACTVLGIVLALVISWLTEHFTGTDKGPVTEVAASARTGPATLILSGFSLGLESSCWGAISIAVSFFIALQIFDNNVLLAAYGIALSGLGLLTTTGFILAMDTFGPISDNANGIFEMSGALKDHPVSDDPSKPSGHKIVNVLDSAGNTTKALTKGFAIATAVIAAVALLNSFVTQAHLSLTGLRIDDPHVFIGMLIGGAAPFLFSSFAINAVSRAAYGLVLEVRRQFHEMPGIMEGTQTPDYARCVAISTAAAQRELLGPGILAICLPLLVGFGLGPYALGGYLASAIVTGQLMAVFLSNSGGAWDNAKKKIEDGFLGGKGTEAHKAGVIGDTVGDPFKDTAGPALNPLIKVMNLVGLLIAGALIPTSPPTVMVKAIVIVVTGVALTYAIMVSKRSTLVDMDTDI